MANGGRPKRGVPEGLWIRCPQCKATVFRKEAESRYNVCPECEYHFYMPARERIRQLLDTLKSRFGIRLFDAIGGAGALTLLTDGNEIYARTAQGHFFNLLRAPSQPLLVVGVEPSLRELTARVHAARKRRKKRKKSANR